MTLGKIVDKILKYHAEALLRTDISKKYSWALYQTWKWADEHERVVKT